MNVCKCLLFVVVVATVAIVTVQHWDLLTITQNYMELIIHYVSTSSGGMLLHCISGWDRTPLFISLLRLSLWADGAIHTSLGARDILYLTVAYDWFLFGLVSVMYTASSH